MEHWRKVVFSRVEIWWNAGSKNGETRGWTTVHPGHRQVCHRWRWYGLWHRHRIEPCSKVTVILAKGEWSIAKDIGPFFNRCNARHRQTFFHLGSVCVFTHWKHLYSWWRITQTIYIPSKNTGNDLTLKQMFDISEKLIIEQSGEIFGVSQISWEGSP